MSELPPNDSNQPPVDPTVSGPVPPIDPANPGPNFAAYPRGTMPQGSADRLEALCDGYFGLNTVFLINVVLALGTRLIPVVTKSPSNALALLTGAYLLILFLIAFLTYPHNKKIGYGKGWPDGNAIVASILMGINSALCCGIIGYVVMQQIAATEMKKYGVSGGVFGIKKSAVKERIANIRAQESGTGAV